VPQPLLEVYNTCSGPVATLVQRSARFLMLVALPGGNHKVDVVAAALAAAVATRPPSSHAR
jgi:hypothetical protein